MVRTHLKQSIYLIEEPLTGLCLRCPPPPSPEDPEPRPRLTPRAVATMFPTRQDAEEAFARLLGAAPLEIVRADA